MASRTKDQHPNFLKYMDFIAGHSCYDGLAIKEKNKAYVWVATAKSDIGKKRIEWCLKKAFELGLIISPKQFYSGIYADTMLLIHPTKWKVCQICGREMSLFYHYPSSNFLKSINKKFNTNFTSCDHISDIWDALLERGIDERDIKKFLVQKCKIDLNSNLMTKEEIINKIEFACRKMNKKILGPGAMSNFPDRFDGFHSYNRCCRSIQDKGRSSENLKTYSKDRRAYEYWSDGNIRAANQFMSSDYFRDISADHIGPISLGFVHDSCYLQPMLGHKNSSKRDRLSIEDIEKIVKIESQTNICPISWYSKKIWEYIRVHYQSASTTMVLHYRDILKQNMANFMHILYVILDLCSDNGKDFLLKVYLEPKLKFFGWNYKFGRSGEIISRSPRHFTDRNRSELDRYKRVAIESVYEYHRKNNRKNDHDLQKSEIDALREICQLISKNSNAQTIKEMIEKLLETIQARLIQKMS